MSWFITLFQRTPRLNYRVWKKKKKNSEKDPKSKNTENQDPVIQQKIKKQYQVNININWKQTKILEPTQEDKNMKFEQKPKKSENTDLGMISDPSFHGPTCIVMLYSEPNVRYQTPIILGDRALHLTIIKHTHSC